MSQVQQPEITKLAEAFCRDELDERQRGRLDALICADEALRRQYLHYLHMHVCLRRAFEGPAAVVGALSRPSDSPLNRDDIAATLKYPPATPSRCLADRLAWIEPGEYRYRFWSTVTVLTVIFLAGLVVLVRSRAPEAELAQSEVSRILPLVAYVTRSHACRWREGSWQPQQGAALRKGQTLELVSGLLEITLRSGARVIVEGPAKYRADGTNSSSLELGKLAAWVPSEAVGFSVKTPSATITDLGTEFGVVVDKRGDGDVTVFKGLVEVLLDASGGRSEEEASRLVLAEGQAVRVIGGRLVEPVADKAAPHFVRAMPAEEESQEESAAWNGKTLPLGNLFDDPAGRKLVDAVPSDSFGAEADVSDLGVDWIATGDFSVPVMISGKAVRFNFASAGAGHEQYGNPTNDCIPQEYWGIRLTGSGAKAVATSKIEDGVGVHSNSLVTFDLNELREAGLPRGELVFRATGALNDSGVQAGTLFAIVLLSNSDGVVGAYVNGRAVVVTQDNGIWMFTGPMPPCLCGKKGQNRVGFNVPLPSSVQYLTLAMTDTGDGFGYDHGVFSRARLETPGTRTKSNSKHVNDTLRDSGRNSGK